MMEIEVAAVALTYDKRLLRSALRAAGNEVAALARAKIRGSSGGGRRYPVGSGAFHVASAAGQPPTSLSGRLESGLRVKVTRGGDRVIISDAAVAGDAFYARFLETGAKGGAGSGRKGVKGTRNSRRKGAAPSTGRILQPRPFLSAALEEREASLAERLKAAIIQGTKFQRLPVKARSA